MKQHLINASTFSNEYSYSLPHFMQRLKAVDRETFSHCVAVKNLALKMATFLRGFSEDELLYLEWGCLLHDIGKLRIPKDITSKCGSLSALEYGIMRQHPTEGGNLVATYSLPRQITDIIMYHHERYDGAGYPFGLAFNDIPLTARICSVADAYDAMVSNRPYRRAMTHDAAMHEISINRGLQFDPIVVDVFEKLVARP